MPMPPTVAEKLAAMGVTLEQARGFVFDHLDNPGMLAIAAHEHGITIDMLAQIVGHGASGLDVANFFASHGIGHQDDGEINLPPGIANGSPPGLGGGLPPGLSGDHGGGTGGDDSGEDDGDDDQGDDDQGDDDQGDDDQGDDDQGDDTPDEPGGGSANSELVHSYIDAMHEAMDAAGHPPEGGMSAIVHQYIDEMVTVIGAPLPDAP